MAPQDKMKLPQQDAGFEHPTPPPTPPPTLVKETFSNTETIQDQAHPGIEVASSALSTDALPIEPSTPEQDTQGESTTQPSSLAVMKPKIGDKSDDRDIAGLSNKGNQEEGAESKSPKPSSSAPAAIPNDATIQEEIQRSRPSADFDDDACTLLPYEEFRNTWHTCDSCGNILRCSHSTSETQSDHDEVSDGEGQSKAVEECSTVWNGAADHDGIVVQPGQDWNVRWDTAPQPTKAGGEAEAPTAAPEDPLFLLVKYDSRPFPDSSGASNTGERGASYTIVSGILPSDPYPTVMIKILHRLKGADGTHNPYPIAPTAQIDYVDIQFGAIAAHAPGFLGRRKIEEDNVGDLLNYLRQRTGGDDILEVFLVPMNEQDPQEHVPKTFEDWMIERAKEGKDGRKMAGKISSGEIMYHRLIDTYGSWVAEKMGLWTETSRKRWKQTVSLLWGGCKEV